MILVQNRLQPLNGNNKIVFFIFLLFIFTSTSKANSLLVATSKNEILSNTFLDDSFKLKPELFDIESGSSNTKNTNLNGFYKDPNRIHNIVVLLPFFLDQIPLGNYIDDSTKVLSIDTKNSIEFYLGCQLARKKFVSYNLKANVYFMDDKNDSLKTTTLFNSKPFPNVDFVVGPFISKNLKTVANLAKINQMSLISPFVNSMYIKNNPYYFNANASLKTQYSFILDNIQSKYPTKKIEIIYDGLDSTAENISHLKYLINDVYKITNVKYTALRSWDDASKSLYQPDTVSERIILIYSSKEVYVKGIISKLKGIKNHLAIFTASSIKNSKEISSAHSVFTVYPYNSSNSNYTAFATDYETAYEKKPTDVAFLAFDILSHLLNTLDKKQSINDSYFDNYLDANNTLTKFNFKPIISKEGSIDYYDNSFMYLYKLINGSFSLSTP